MATSTENHRGRGSRKRAWYLIVLALVLLLIGCFLWILVARPPIPFPWLPTLTPTPTATPTPTHTPTITPTATPTATPTLTSTPSPGVLVLPKGPDVIYTGQNTEMKIFWQWTASTDFQLEWGSDLSYATGRAAVSAEDATNNLYSFTIRDLAPGTRYFYRVVLGDRSAPGSFFTAPEPSVTALKFVSYGDTRSNPEVHDTIAQQVVRLFQADPAFQTFNLIEGDLVSNGDSESAWSSQFFDPNLKNIRAELANLPDLPVMGNHEGSGKLFTRYFPLPYVAARYWSFDYGPVHVVMLDQYSNYAPGSAQYEWLKKDLEGSTKTWKFAVLHEPGWSAGGGHGNNLEVQNTLQPLFEQTDVSVVFGGHNHYYARAVVNGIQHLTVGTGGAPLYHPDPQMPDIVAVYAGYGYMKFVVEGNTLTGWFVDLNGNVQDTFTVNR